MKTNTSLARHLKPLAHSAVLLLLAGLHPACYNSPAGPTGGPGKITLFSDGFVHAPGSLATSDMMMWTAATDSGTAADIVFPGAYYLDFTLSARSASSTLHATGTTKTSFASQPVTFTVSFEPPAVASFTNHDLMSIIIKDSASAAIVSRADFDVVTGLMTFTTGASMSSTSPAVGSFHDIVFSIDALGNSTWAVGTGFMTSAVAVTPPAMLVLQLQSSYPAGTGAAPLYRFASALVTTP